MFFSFYSHSDQRFMTATSKILVVLECLRLEISFSYSKTEHLLAPVQSLQFGDEEQHLYNCNKS